MTRYILFLLAKYIDMVTEVSHRILIIIVIKI